LSSIALYSEHLKRWFCFWFVSPLLLVDFMLMALAAVFISIYCYLLLVLESSIDHEILPIKRSPNDDHTDHQHPFIARRTNDLINQEIEK
jgi:hypothetical protein